MATRRLMSRVLMAGAAAALLPLGTGTAMAAPAPGANDGPVQVPGGFNASAIPGAQVFANTPPGTPETVSFVLRERNAAQLASAVEQGVAPDLSVSQFAAAYGQSPQVIDQITRYLGGYGISTQVYADRVDVVATGTAGQFDRALSVSQHDYRTPGRPSAGGHPAQPPQSFHGVDRNPEVPGHVAPYITAILGLTNYSPFVSQAVHTESSVVAAPAGGSATGCTALTGLPDACHTPANFASRYGLAGVSGRKLPGTGQTLAIVTLAAVDPGAPQYFWAHVAKVPSQGRLTVANVDGGPGAPSDAAGSGETDLDLEQSGSLAPGARVIDYQAPNTDYGFADAFFMAASQNAAATVSASWGESETAIQAAVAAGQESPGYVAAYDEAFLELAAQGQSTFIASGDEGAYSASADLGTTNLSVGNPADSPFVTAAGGTTLPWSGILTGPAGKASVSVPAERAWGWDYLWKPVATVHGIPLVQSAEAQVVGSTGGFSVDEAEPGYQQGVPGTRRFSAVPYLTPTGYKDVGAGVVEPTQWNFDPAPPVVHGTGSGRAVPDVSTNADPYSGYLLYGPTSPTNEALSLQGGWGGTSFVAPQLNGSAAVIDAAVGHRTGLWNPAMYQAATSHASPFTPLNGSGTANDNLYYTGSARTVYNPATGLGTPDLGKLAATLARPRGPRH